MNFTADQHFQVLLEKHLQWETWGLPGLIICGSESYPQLVFQCQVQPRILATDPGPLDARVP